MWTEALPKTDPFVTRMRDVFQNLSLGCRVIRYPKNRTIYSSGQRDATLYYIVSGRVKLLVPSADGRECLLAIRTAGEIFGELCLSGRTMRFETAVVMKEAILKQVLHGSFLMCLKNESLLESFVRYLAIRIAEQQEVITTLTTANSEQRLARTLIHLSGLLGQNRSCGTCIDQKISQGELARMVGTTRTRIGIFLKKFREHGLIHLNGDRCLMIDEARMREYLETDRLPETRFEGRPDLSLVQISSVSAAPTDSPCKSCFPVKMKL